MAQTLELSSKEVKDWLEKETGLALSPVREKAEKMLKEMQKALDNLEKACKLLLENSQKKIASGNKKVRGRARGLNKLARIFLERIRQITVPEEISYESLNDFVQETKRVFLVTEIDIKNWFPRISPFFILDRRKFLMTFQKAKETTEELYGFLTKKYVKIKTLEETFQSINQLLTLEKQLEKLKAERNKIRAEKGVITKQITQKQQEIEVIKSKNLAQLDQIDVEIEKLRLEVKERLRHLQKPFVKLRWLASHEGGLTPEELRELDHYIENPFHALAQEKGYETLKQILQKLNRYISEGKLKLKLDRRRKAEKTINDILNKKSLQPLHQKCKNTLTLKKQLSTNTKIIAAKEALTKIQREITELEKKRRLNTQEESSLQQKIEEILKKIHGEKKTIEKNITELTRKKIAIKLLR